MMNLGAYRHDRTQKITGSFGVCAWGWGNTSPPNPFYRTGSAINRDSSGGGDWGAVSFAFDSSRAVRTGAKTEPENTVYNICLGVY